MMHFLKITPNHFNEALNGKNFEIRFNDRNFKVDDRITLKEFLGVKHYPTCPDIDSCRRYIRINEDEEEKMNCGIERECCYDYDKEIYSGRKIIGRITAVYDISDITKDNRFDNYVAFKFEIITTRNC